ncbi:MAG: (2Fe-2S) ferredoxin domain-containing protein [Bacteroidia bacterium]|nr:(2Fe-2S) ferredoxin domain-containing protein [Bacteroidia bacterium]
MIYDKHIFICVNQRAEGAARKSCGEAHGMELVDVFKKKLKDKNLPIKLRVQKAGCLDICDFGQTLVLYPEGVFYVGVTVNDVDEIIETHIINNRIVERLKLENVRATRT